MVRHVLREKTTQAVVSSTLVSWRHQLGRDAVCLAPFVRAFAGTGVAIVLSEIAERTDAVGITSDFPGAASAAWAVLGEAAGTDPSQVSWFAQHGPFSSYDPTGPETLTAVTLVFNGSRFDGDLTGHSLLEAGGAARLVHAWQLPPVEDLLPRLGRA
ncbi:hypothetical protein ACFWSF_38180 [Streptomyces sp. NPDC058611]|uniref:hypothetical protein n=1 Tax=unclassified Streptomyces TaxID=2593676 RepID=UPI00364EF433